MEIIVPGLITAGSALVGLALLVAILFFLTWLPNALRVRAEIKHLGKMSERRAKLLALVKSGKIIAIHFGCERYYNENCHVEEYFSVEGQGWILWIAHLTEQQIKVDHSRVPQSVKAIFSTDFEDSIRLARPVLKQLKAEKNATRTIKFWEREVGHAGPCEFGVMRPAGA